MSSFVNELTSLKNSMLSGFLSDGNVEMKSFSSSSLDGQLRVLRRYAGDLEDNMAKAEALGTILEDIGSMSYDSSDFDPDRQPGSGFLRCFVDEEASDLVDSVSDFSQAYGDSYTVTSSDGYVFSFHVRPKSYYDEGRNITTLIDIGVGDVFDPAKVLCFVVGSTVHVTTTILDITGTVTRSFFDLFNAVALSDAINTVVDKAISLLTTGAFTVSDFIIACQTQIDTAMPSIHTLIQRIVCAYEKGGIGGVIKAILTLISSPASLGVSGAQLVWVDNTEFIPQEYIAGMICTIVGTLGQVAGAILAFVSPYIGIAVSLISGVITAIPKMISYDYSTQTLCAFNMGGVTTPTLGVTGLGLAQWEYSQQDIDESERLTQLYTLISNNGTPVYCDVPGGILLIGLGTSGSPTLRVQFHAGLTDPYDQMYEQLCSYFSRYVKLSENGNTTVSNSRITVSRYYFNAQSDDPRDGHYMNMPFARLEGSIFCTPNVIQQDFQANPNTYGDAGGLINLCSVNAARLRYWWCQNARPIRCFKIEDDGVCSNAVVDQYVRYCLLGNVSLFLLWLCATGNETDYSIYGQPFIVPQIHGSLIYSTPTLHAFYEFIMSYFSGLYFRVALQEDVGRAMIEYQCTEDMISPSVLADFITGSGTGYNSFTDSGLWNWVTIVKMFAKASSLQTYSYNTHRYVIGDSSHNTFVVETDTTDSRSIGLSRKLYYALEHSDEQGVIGGLVAVPQTVSATLIIPKYNRSTFWFWVAATTAATLIVTAVVAFSAVKISHWRRMRQLKNQIAVESAWNRATQNPTEANIKAYRKTARKANFWRLLCGGTKFSKTNYWNSDVPGEVTADSSAGDILNSFKTKYLTSDSKTVQNNNDEISVLKHLIVG